MNPQNAKPYDENEIIDIDPALEYENIGDTDDS